MKFTSPNEAIRLTTPAALPRTVASERLTSAEWRHRILMAALGTGTLIASRVYAPWCTTGPTMCPFRLLTGLPCPGCGLTRSFCSLAQGRVMDAFSYHIFGPVLAVGLLVGVPLLVGEILTHRRNPLLRQILFSEKLAVLSACALGLYHAGRLAWWVHTGALWQGMQHSLIASMLRWIALGI